MTSPLDILDARDRAMAQIAARLEPISVTQISVIKALVDQLADLDLSPLHLRVDAKHVGDMRPDVSMWLRYRTDFERYCAALKLKATERKYRPQGQREWFAEHDTPERRLLVQCVSFEHHDDWQPRPLSPAAATRPRSNPAAAGPKPRSQS